METLVERILSLEKAADALLAKAHHDAAELERRADDEVTAYRQHLAEDASRRIESYRAEAEQHYQEALAQAESELQAQLDALDRLDASVVQRETERVVQRFRTW